MIDIHTHILPGIDDGAQNWEDMLGLARAAEAEGISTIVATPHHANGTYDNEADAVLELVDETNRLLKAEGVDVRVLPGQEIRYHDSFLDAWERGELLAVGEGTYLLVEMPSGSIPKGLGDLVHELSILGLRVIIAHPERNVEIVRHPERLAELVGLGAYAQVTTHSLLGGFGKGVEANAWLLCRKGLIHIVSSDAHHVHRRGFRLREAYDRVGRELGATVVRTFQKNTEALIAGAPLAAVEPIGSNSTRIRDFFSSFFHK